MFVRGTLRLGRIAGIEIAVHPSWLLVYALFAWNATVVASQDPETLSRAAIVALGLVYSALLFVSVVLHELSHAIVARRLGIPIGGITLFLFGGVANIKREPGSPKDELAMAAAGPAASVVIGLLCWAIAWPLPESMVWANDLFWFLGLSNIALAIFNLLPAFPSDGGRILRALLWQIGRSQARATRNASAISIGMAVLLVGLGIGLEFFHRDIAGHDTSTSSYIAIRGGWLILIGIFLFQAAMANFRGSRAGIILESLKVGECMARTLIPVPAGTTIAGYVAEMAVNGRGAAYPVVKDGSMIGLVTLQDTSAVPHVLWQQTPITAVMTSADRTPPIPVTAAACDALAALDEKHVGELPVFENGSLTGVVSKETIYAALREREKAAGS
jgi:Zn-dependent protease